ncbi:MAG: hypothetical protein HY548_01980 [Elusimicrobia bacterium]|nr:hypothetical protein [Elusimicrobiota bacterium]
MSYASSLPYHILVRKAEAARYKKLWEEAIRHYQLALKYHPDDPVLYRGLGMAYEGKCDETKSTVFLDLAISQYRSLLRINPHSAEAHDLLLAAVVRTERLDDLLTEYKAHLAADPMNRAVRTTLKKIETFLLLKTTPKEALQGPSRVIWWALEVGLPLLSFTCFLGGFYFRWKTSFTGSHGLSLICFRSSLLLLVSYIGYKLFLTYQQRHS